MSLLSLSSLVKCLQVRPEPTHVEPMKDTLLLALIVSIRLGWKGSLETNTLAFWSIRKLQRKKVLESVQLVIVVQSLQL